MKMFLMLHGINHNMFGKRDPKQYGTITLDQINAQLKLVADELSVGIQTFQTNSEAEMAERIPMDKLPERQTWRDRRILATRKMLQGE